jgi:hypothetical protein
MRINQYQGSMRMTSTVCHSEPWPFGTMIQKVGDGPGQQPRRAMVIADKTNERGMGHLYVLWLHETPVYHIGDIVRWVVGAHRWRVSQP